MSLSPMALESRMNTRFLTRKRMPAVPMLSSQSDARAMSYERMVGVADIALRAVLMHQPNPSADLVRSQKDRGANRKRRVREPSVFESNRPIIGMYLNIVICFCQPLARRLEL